ncbi:MAG: 6-carboxytetrahydropterin synthase QueD [Dehalococcoidales bacterium]|nr:MAG: 6-carboxytetrahydropterin synthase QueD [Dehalococcoidales bacterium]
MYTIAIEQHFDAAHFLRGYQGKCESMHGHRYRVVARVTATKLDDIGLAYDFSLLKQHLGEILSRFDHTCLNDVTPFDEINPSSENIAATVYQELKPKLKGEPVTITSIEVWETPQSWVSYSLD